MSGVAVRLREAVIAQIEFLRKFNVISRTGLPQTQPDQLPWSGVFISREVMQPDGNGNVSEARFVSDITIAISVMRGFKTTDQLDTDIDQDFADILSSLLSDPGFFGFRNGMFESVERVDVRRLFPLVGETYVCELRMEITFRTRVGYEPDVQDDYRRTVMTTRPLGSDGAPAITTQIDQA